eukprot:COSAG06_NODE_1365_length_9687_cov_14.601064_12_plen_166_part_00
MNSGRHECVGRHDRRPPAGAHRVAQVRPPLPPPPLHFVAIPFEFYIVKNRSHLPRQARDKHTSARKKLKTQNSSACRFCSGEDGSTGSLQYFDEDFEEWTALVAVRFHANSSLRERMRLVYVQYLHVKSLFHVNGLCAQAHAKVVAAVFSFVFFCSVFRTRSWRT